VGIPGTVDLERTKGLPGIGVAQIESDAAVFVLELLDRVEGRIGAGDVRNRRIQSAARDEQQRKAGAGLLEMDTDGTPFIETHDNSSRELTLPTPRLRSRPQASAWPTARLRRGRCPPRSRRSRIGATAQAAPAAQTWRLPQDAV